MDSTPRTPTAAISDTEAMHAALRCARAAAKVGEVPVGAVVVHAGRIIGSGHNTPIADQDPSAHAEINALREAARRLGNYRLDACTLYVTLEPCIMCAGAILTARIGRVVFAAADPKAGAAGSVVDLFADSRLNHQTRVQGGLLAEQGRAILREFFSARRTRNEQPLRDDALRTPDAAFEDLPDYPWPPSYISDLPALNGLRMHYVDAGTQDAEHTWLLLHGSPLWSYTFRHMIAALASRNQRVIAPDLPGFGKSDKPKRARAHERTWYVQILQELVAHLDLRQVTLVGQGLGSQLAARLLAGAPARYAAALFLGATASETQLPATEAPSQTSGTTDAGKRGAWSAPFPNAGFKAAVRRWESESPDALEELSIPEPPRWSGRAMAVRSDLRGNPSVVILAAQARTMGAAVCRHGAAAWLGSADATSTVVDQILASLNRDRSMIRGK